MEEWLTSDLHFGHKNILKFCSKTRPFSDTCEMENYLVEYWNSVVKPEDTVYHLGDFSFLNVEQTKRIISRLQGNIIFVEGNHDKALQGFKCCKHKMLTIKRRGFSIILCHYALRVWDKMHYGSLHAYGHSHGSLPAQGRSMDVGWDAIESFITVDDFIDKLKDSPIVDVDGH